MRFRTVGNKYDVAFVVVRNQLSTTVPLGAPVFYVMNGTNDGLDITNATTAAGAGQEFLAGVAAQAIPANGYGEAQVFGLCLNTRIVTITRPASTDSYNSVTAIVQGDILQVNTLVGVDAFSRSAAGAATAILPNIIMVGSYSSTASQSSSFDTTSRTAITTTLKTFLRII